MKENAIIDQSETEIKKFWTQKYEEAKTLSLVDSTICLPLARIKKLMRVEENVKNIAGEVAYIFSKITETFLEELTLRAWQTTKTKNRKVVQCSDIYQATKTSEIYDFLVYIITKRGFDE